MKCALKRRKPKIAKWKECKEKSTSTIVRSAHQNERMHLIENVRKEKKEQRIEK
jgi:hypothetical protein